MSALIIQKLRGKIRNRQPFTTSKGNPFLIGYLTEGGTYIIASSGGQTDSGLPHDLVAIVPGLAGWDIHQLRVNANPQLITEVEDIMARQS